MTLSTEWLGTVGYGAALALQEQAVLDRRAGRTGDRLLLLEHPAVVTLGRGSHEEHLLTSRADLLARGVEAAP